MYLVLGKPAKGSDASFRPTPFLVSLPSQNEDGTWDYHTEVYAKIRIDDDYLEDTLKRRVIKNWDDFKGDDLLPQTGQLWWPIPLFAVMGIMCFIIGWVQRKNWGE